MHLDKLHIITRVEKKINKIIKGFNNSEVTITANQESIKNLEERIEELELRIKKILYTIGR
jgi:predicted  nucleic acid-binding Zn-ribbon protein|tara:strand:- start:806 stop:988 length:183 start_codon:yes stop_codon:yes gene_type:complete